MTSPGFSRSSADRPSVAHNTAVLLGSQAVTWTLSTLVVLVVPRLVGPADIGRYTVALAIWGIASVAIGLGTSFSVTLETARDPRQATALMGGALRARAVTTSAAWLAVLAYVLAVDGSRQFLVLAVVVGVATTGAAIVDVGAAALAGQERMGAIAGADIISRLASTVTVLIVVVTTRNIIAVAMVGTLIPIVRGAAIARTLRGPRPSWRESSWPEARALAKRSQPYFVAGIALIVYQQVDTIALSLFVDERQVGWYAVAIGAMGTFLFGANILMTALAPAMARAHAHDQQSARDLLTQAFDSMVVIALPIGVSMAVCAKPAIRLILGDDYAPAVPILEILAVVVVLVHFAMLLGAYAAVTDRQRFWNANIGVAIVLSVALDAVLVPWAARRHDNGGIGGALAYVVTDALMVGIGIASLAPHLVSSARLARFGRCALAAGAAFAVGWSLRSTFVLIAGVATVSVYIAAILALRVLTPAEQRQVRSLVDALRRRLGQRALAPAATADDPEPSD